MSVAIDSSREPGAAKPKRLTQAESREPTDESREPTDESPEAIMASRCELRANSL
jgi:hypothetical protein